MTDYIDRRVALQRVNEFFHDPRVDIVLSELPAIGPCCACSNWRGELGDKFAACVDSGGIMEADNFCRNFNPVVKHDDHT